MDRSFVTVVEFRDHETVPQAAIAVPCNSVSRRGFALVSNSSRHLFLSCFYQQLASSCGRPRQAVAAEARGKQLRKIEDRDGSSARQGEGISAPFFYVDQQLASSCGRPRQAVAAEGRGKQLRKMETGAAKEKQKE